MAAGDPIEPRPGGFRLVRPDRPRAVLARRRRRGVAAVAPGLQRVLQAAGLHAGPAPGTDDRTRPSGTAGRTHADKGTVAASGVSRVDLRADAGVARRAPGEPLNGRARALTPGQRRRRR